MKNNAFAAVAAVVVPNYDNMTEAKQREAVQVVQKRWRTARDAYRRDRNKVKNTKSGQAAKKYKTYIFYDNLKFLDQVMELNSTETNFDCTNKTWMRHVIVLANQRLELQNVLQEQIQ
ncbi:uncharacterized protein [Leptinotarsa decemlineata]|uniref:uncharacterized protein n=1 Tax=Leptinotarsa decemlineata TaxID=7539 RepID=UPI003D30CC00